MASPINFNTCLSCFDSTYPTSVVHFPHACYRICGNSRRIVYSISAKTLNPRQAWPRTVTKRKQPPPTMIRRVNVNGNGVAVLSRAIGIGGGGATSATNQRLLQAALYGTTAHSNAKSNPHWLSSRVLADRFGPFAPSSVPNGVVGTRFIHSLAEEPPRADKFFPKDAVLFQYEACPFCNKVKGIRLN